jgi:hypothetical protein
MPQEALRSANPGDQSSANLLPEASFTRYKVSGAVTRERTLHFTVDVVAIQPLIALIFGILILILPRILNYLVAIYLIIIGLIGLWPHLFEHIARGTT